MAELLKGLNEQQKQAVVKSNGILLVLAGAGSGKTRVLTTRIAYLVESGVKPYNVLGVTFTNKAAKEMKNRLEKNLGEEVVRNLWVGTFHGICGRILRQDIESYKNEEGISWNRNFTIYDQDESLAVIKAALKHLNMDDKIYKPKVLQIEISNAKNKMLNAYQFACRARDYRTDKVAQVYDFYEKALSVNNALDFDDLLLMAVNLLEQNEEIRTKYHNKFRHILVDEFQDTNLAQYKLIKLLFTNAKPAEELDLSETSLCVVGDVDQSIYSWRGADYKILLNFRSDFPEAKMIKLEQNYRSVGTILEAANKIIKNNFERVEKNLYSTKGRGKKIECYEADDQAQEAYYIARQVKDNGLSQLKNTAVLYRTNAQSRAIEEAFMSSSIPYRMVGGLKFYERKEIKDIVAYLRLVYNLSDNQGLKRIINVPKRSIGPTTVKKLEELAYKNSTSMFSILGELENVEEFSAATKKHLQGFRNLVLSLVKKQKEFSLSEFISELLLDTLYIKELEDEGTEEAQVRIENIQEFINVAREFEEIAQENEFGEFLAQVALVSDVDEIDEASDAVTLMTLHSAKGLEYPVVFLSGLEEGIFPHSRSLNNNSEMEEERRLMYVGITRAEEKLYITYARRRQMWGEYRYGEPSRFISEIPDNLVNSNISQTSPAAYRPSTFGEAVKSLNQKRQGYDNDNPVSSSFGKNFVPPFKKETSAAGGFGKNFEPPVLKKKTTEKGTKKEFKNMINGIEQARAIAQKLKEQKNNQMNDEIDIEHTYSFKNGDVVMHEKFGIGKVQGAITIGKSILYKIDFDKNGIRAIDAQFNRLMPVE
ncbi:MAG: 3'-5' exonuclease [Candidatus Gastranaerophilales bacterium]|nr:3'-5' exonuclease [Candidatus Gastranaerophilales bacterium]